MLPTGGVTIESSKNPLFVKSIARLRNAKRDITDERPAHDCSRQFCNPQSELMLFPHDPITSNVFLCKYGVIHICSEYTCDNYKHDRGRSCHISGFQFGNQQSSYDSGDYRTWYSKPDGVQQQQQQQQNEFKMDSRLLLSQSGSAVGVAAAPPLQSPKRVLVAAVAAQPPPPPPPRFESLTDEQIADRAGNWITLLLFSKKRTAINQLQQKVFNQRAAEAKQSYIREQYERRQLPYWMDIYRIVGNHTSMALPLKEFVFDPHLQAYYVAVIKQVWKKAMRYLDDSSNSADSPCRVDFDDICLGVLFMMRKGMHLKGINVLPGDDFLLENLPWATMLPDFDIQKGRMSKCDELVTKIYTRAIEAGATEAELVLNVDELPVRVDATAAASTRTKIGSSGEKLFMPSSRKRPSSSGK